MLRLEERPWRQTRLPDGVLTVPSMLSAEERALLYVLARDYADPEVGAIVDAGCFLGGSTVALLAGLQDRAARWTGPPVASFDLFKIERYTYDTFFAAHDGRRVGDSFRDLYDHYVGRFDGPHVTYEGDLARIGWDGGPIEVLFLDVLKSWKLANAVQRSFLPRVVPGRTVIVHQDYGFSFNPWIHLGVELMWDSLRFIDSMPNGTHVFLVVEPLPPRALKVDLRRIRHAHKLELLERARARWPPGSTTGAMVELGKAVLLTERGRRREALDIVAATRRRCDDPLVVQCVEVMEQWIGTVSAWRARLPRVLAGRGIPGRWPY